MIELDPLVHIGGLPRLHLGSVELESFHDASSIICGSSHECMHDSGSTQALQGLELSSGFRLGTQGSSVTVAGFAAACAGPALGWGGCSAAAGPTAKPSPSRGWQQPGRGSFSFCAARYSRGAVLYRNTRHRPLDHWIRCTDQGDFDRHQPQNLGRRARRRELIISRCLRIASGHVTCPSFSPPERSGSRQRFFEATMPRLPPVARHRTRGAREEARETARTATPCAKLLNRDFHFGRPDQNPYTPNASPHGQISLSDVVPLPTPVSSGHARRGTDWSPCFQGIPQTPLHTCTLIFARRLRCTRPRVSLLAPVAPRSSCSMSPNSRRVRCPSASRSQ